MKKSVMKKWVKALRSGEYVQGKYGLISNDDKFCCLGVLCDIAPKDLGYWGEIEKDYWAFVHKIDGVECYNPTLLPFNVQKWSGMFSVRGIVRGTIDGGVSLSVLNDLRNYNFEQIADYIEENWETL